MQITGWTVTTITGVVAFAAAPTSGAVTDAGFEYDVPLPFETDTLDVNLDFERLGPITSIPLIEVRDETSPNWPAGTSG